MSREKQAAAAMVDDKSIIDLPPRREPPGLTIVS
jgi:hypothetical protein